ncbi:MAG: NAD(P)-binding protein, partial [Kofleriaceae bacterium]
MTTTNNKKPRVTVFGAGIAGLTAAHELAIRGFDVQVIDKEYNEEFDRSTTLDRGIGGMARSQFAFAPSGTLANKEMERLWSGAELLSDVSIRLKPEGTPFHPDRANDIVQRLKTALNELRKHGYPPSTIQIRVHTKDASVPDVALDDPRVAWLVAALTDPKKPDPAITSMFVTWESQRSDLLTFVPGGHPVAGEHGFRFFPSFYRHLFDTMRRTPILKPRPSERTKANTYQNLVPSEGLGFARDGKAVSFMVPRRRLSMEAMRTILGDALEQLGYTGSDVSRFALKLFKYMTSGTKRRVEDYENMSWGHFLDVDRYSAISREHIEFGPQMSAALRGSASDARTQGNITVQLLADQMEEDSRADFTLAGPTSGAWFDHWHDFLLDQGVKFHRGEIVGFTSTAHPIVKPSLEEGGPQITGTVFVIALSLPGVVPVAEALRRVVQSAADANDLKRLQFEPDVDANPVELKVEHMKLKDLTSVIEFGGNVDVVDVQGLASPTPKGPLQHLSGIQFFFDQDLRVWRGHTQYLDSAWGLTSVSQPQFWNRLRFPRDQYRSLLSVDIGIFDRVYRPQTPFGEVRPEGIKAWECTAAQLAHFAWEQIESHHDDAMKRRYGPRARLPKPIAYAIDATLSFSDKSTQSVPRDGVVSKNESTFLVNKTGEYPTRPGKLNSGKGQSKGVSLYDMILNRYVLAGTYMKTFTRLTSMEGANESARHAVNAILQKWDIPGDRCDIWDPEDYEPDDLQWLREFDDELRERDLPHFSEILGWNELPDQIDQLKVLARQFSRDHRR